MKKIYFCFAALQVTQLIFATVCAPHSCEWGNGVYFYAGITCLIISALLSFFAKEKAVGQRTLYSVLFIVIAVIVWCAGFMLFGFRIMCRLI